MGFLDKAKAAAEQAANRANETVADVQTKRELTKAYGELGEKAYSLADSGAISHPDLSADVERIRELHAKLAEEDGGADAPLAQPDADAPAAAAADTPAAPGSSEAAGAGAAAATADSAAPTGGSSTGV